MLSTRRNGDKRRRLLLRWLAVTTWVLLCCHILTSQGAIIDVDEDGKDLIVPYCGRSQSFPNHRQPKTSREPQKVGGETSRRSKMMKLFLADDTSTEIDAEDEGSGRILQGTKALKGSWPWQASIQLELSDIGNIGHWCGGVLIHPHWILTAAHCIQNPMFENFGQTKWSAILSEHNRKFLGNDGEIVLPIEKVIIHPKFDEYQNDIAMLRLPSDPRLGRLSPACLPATPLTRQETFLGVRCLATGWGQTVFGGDLEDSLHQVELTVVDSGHCRDAYGSTYNISILSQHLCAGPLYSGGMGTCVGDSGGPIHCNMKDGRWYLAGITSFGSGCARPGFPDVFTRLTSYVDWIRSVVNLEDKLSTVGQVPRKRRRHTR